jgi:hypothetical protein
VTCGRERTTGGMTRIRKDNVTAYFNNISNVAPGTEGARRRPSGSNGKIPTFSQRRLSTGNVNHPEIPQSHQTCLDHSKLLPRFLQFIKTEGEERVECRERYLGLRGNRKQGCREGYLKRRFMVCKVKVKCTIVQALRLCTGRTAHRESRGIAILFHDQR